MRRSESCSNCHFHEEIEDEKDTVECHVKPPRSTRVLNDNFPSNATRFPGYWPAIRRSRWCGKWKALEKPPEAVAVRVTSTVE